VRGLRSADPPLARFCLRASSVDDVVPLVVGVAVDISHINTKCEVKGFAGDFKDKEASKAALHKALAGVDIVVIPAGVPRKPGMTRDDL
jgi:malate/lactate dehydrogenase